MGAPPGRTHDEQIHTACPQMKAIGPTCRCSPAIAVQESTCRCRDADAPANIEIVSLKVEDNPVLKRSRLKQGLAKARWHPTLMVDNSGIYAGRHAPRADAWPPASLPRVLVGM
jgi:hypothetical protein